MTKKYHYTINSDIKDFIEGTCDTFIIPNNTTKIGEYTFYEVGFRRIIIPKSVTKIERLAFYYCEDLEEIYFDGTPYEFSFVKEDDWCLDCPKVKLNCGGYEVEI